MLESLVSNLTPYDRGILTFYTLAGPSFLVVGEPLYAGLCAGAIALILILKTPIKA